MFEFDVNYYLHGFYNTLDLDFDEIPDINLSCSKDKVEKIISKMKKCSNLLDVKKEFSDKKGYHLRFYCSEYCDKCRFVFDDTIRYNADSTRKKEFTNIMFDTKKGY
jgi:hypothetical protein